MILVRRPGGEWKVLQETKPRYRRGVADPGQVQMILAAAHFEIGEVLDQGLRDSYDRALLSRKTPAVFEHVFSAYQGVGKSIYGEAA